MVVIIIDGNFGNFFQVVFMAKQRTYSKYAQEAALLLGKQIKPARKQRKWSEQNLADRAGISRVTLQKMENGEMTCAIGLVFEAAALVGGN
jgi:DNA-binding XRE family transcriptional regulator